MKRVILQEPGTFLLQDVPEPPRGSDQVRVRVHRVGVCGTDIHAYHGRQPFFNYPRVLGHELAVEVLEVPIVEKRLCVGDLCSVEPYLNCGTCIACRSGKSNCCERLEVLGVHIDGGMQPILSLPADKLHPAKGLSLDQLALVETLGIGAHGVEKANIQDGEFVLIAGAGPIGLSVLPFALARGGRVVVMDVNERRLDFCRDQMGISMTLNPAKDSLPEALCEFGRGGLPTAVLDATGNPGSMQGCFDLIAPGGRIVFIGLYPGKITFDDPNFHRREITLYASRNSLPSTFHEIINLIQSGKIDTSPWITHRLGLDEVPDYFEEVTSSVGLVKAMISI